MKATLYLLLLLLLGCRGAKPDIEGMYQPQANLALDSLRLATVTPQPTLVQRLFGTGKAKLKNVTIQVNQQTATHGSTIGSSDQSGPDNSKTKESAVSDAKAANTGGQGAQVSGSAHASASNTPRKGWGWLEFWAGVAVTVGLWLGGKWVKKRFLVIK